MGGIEEQSGHKEVTQALVDYVRERRNRTPRPVQRGASMSSGVDVRQFMSINLADSVPAGNSQALANAYERLGRGLKISTDPFGPDETPGENMEQEVSPPSPQPQAPAADDGRIGQLSERMATVEEAVNALISLDNDLGDDVLRKEGLLTEPERDEDREESPGTAQSRRVDVQNAIDRMKPELLPELLPEVDVGVMFAVRLWRDGGTSSGDTTTKCNRTYTVRTEDATAIDEGGTLLGTAMSPLRVRPTVGMMLCPSDTGAGTVGQGYYNASGTFILYDANETEENSAECDEGA